MSILGMLKKFILHFEVFSHSLSLSQLINTHLFSMGPVPTLLFLLLTYGQQNIATFFYCFNCSLSFNCSYFFFLFFVMIIRHAQSSYSVHLIFQQYFFSFLISWYKIFVSFLFLGHKSFTNISTSFKELLQQLIRCLCVFNLC